MRRDLRVVIWSTVVIFLAAACGQAAPTPSPSQPPPPTEIVLAGSTSQGGRLYDKWWTEAGLDAPSSDAPLWATQSTNTRSGADTWRCKECHGWDYRGAEGAYGSGSHFTGFAGVLSASDMSDADLLAILDGSANPDHDFSAMGNDALASLVTFLQEGLVDAEDYINYETKSSRDGDASHGEQLFGGTCVACHGGDGRLINFGSADEPEFVGTIAVDNPWEFIHKVRSGQPGAPMPSAIDSGWTAQDVIDLLAYVQTLPSEAAAVGSVSRGGRLYDKWWKEAGVDEPTGDSPIWARQSTNTRSGPDTWRCKECHGWDYEGSEGAYGSGSHYTGFPGLFAAQDKSFDDLVAQLTGAVDSQHDFSAMGEQAIRDLVAFLKEGLVDESLLIEAGTDKPVGGDAAHGQDLFGTCAACHGDDGRLVNFGSADEPEFVGTIAVDNPWEFIHKVRTGQPGEAMPAAIDVGWSLQDVLDLLAFSQTLPTAAP